MGKVFIKTDVLGEASLGYLGRVNITQTCAGSGLLLPRVLLFALTLPPPRQKSWRRHEREKQPSTGYIAYYQFSQLS